MKQTPLPILSSRSGRFISVLLCLLAWVAWLPGTIPSARATAEELQQHLLVVYNKSAVNGDKLAALYADKRKIPANRVLAIDCPDTEEIDRATYNEKIRDSIDAYLTQQGWLKRQESPLAIGPRTIQVQVATQNEIWVIVLIRGVPLKIRNDDQQNDGLPLQPALNYNYAAVDSELATLPTMGLPLNGPILNPYYFAGYARDFDQLDARRQILVTRLDGPTAADVERMITESLTAEANRLTGYACLDARGITDKNNPYSLGDTWLRGVLISLTHEGWPIEFDNRPELIPANRPITQVALYAGWYEANAQGPFFQPPRRFVPGAVAYHLHSYSASTIRSKTEAWCGPLIAAGADATMGSVYEPYLDLTPHLDVFFDRLLQGYTFAEAAYMSQKGLSWTITMIGDPLYRPFREKLPDALANARKENRINLDWLELQQAHLNFRNDPTAVALLKKQFVALGAGDFLWEGYGDLLARDGTEENRAEIIQAYKQAMKLYFGPIDQIRVGLKLAEIYDQTDQRPLARNVLKQLLEKWPRESAFYGVDTASAAIAKNALPRETTTTSAAVVAEPAPLANEPTAP